ncbi:DNA gyrase inhibitor YacG [Pseudophaeobacter leonis]|uniref:DNA gyrase inhibitor YacG n=1 Tax=Pseudophaeobacter leonis TaxID=1144477 RepID=UPI0009F18C1F|nr:DNA gyrase inhibitor YacG [Pseudophaeobacter leonis]
MSCPICGAATEHTHRPFCSKRCADIDLAKWMNGSYAVPSSDPEDIENALEEAEQAAAKAASPTSTRH